MRKYGLISGLSSKRSDCITSSLRLIGRESLCRLLSPLALVKVKVNRLITIALVTCITCE
jgi:hypothetical protein